MNNCRWKTDEERKRLSENAEIDKVLIRSRPGPARPPRRNASDPTPLARDPPARTDRHRSGCNRPPGAWLVYADAWHRLAATVNGKRPPFAKPTSHSRPSGCPMASLVVRIPQGVISVFNYAITLFGIFSARHAINFGLLFRLYRICCANRVCALVVEQENHAF